MRRISLVASREHYLDHLVPVWHALPVETRGDVVVRTHELARAAAERGLAPISRRLSGGHAALTAAWIDSRTIQGQPVAMLEHGAGQTYIGDGGKAHGSYSGGEQRENVGLFLCPSETVAARNQAAYPAARVAVVGCPKLDAHHTREWSCGGEHCGSTIAMTFHWDGRAIAPEARWALPHYRAALPRLAEWAAETDVQLLGHAHPRVAARLQPLWRKLGVPWATADEVLRLAGVLVVDNSSIGYEFASLGKPVLWLNAPWYRRNASHGLRFWDCVPGHQVGDPADLITGVVESLEDPVGELCCKVVPEVYAYADGHCAERAAAALLEWVG